MPDAQISPATLRHWQAIHGAGDIQTAPLPPWQPAPPPNWLASFMRWLAHAFDPLAHALGGGWPLVKWGLIALAAVVVLALGWRLIVPLVARLRRLPAPSTAEADWAPARAEAEALLADADALAAAGRFDEATHLLLRRSVDHIRHAAPHWLRPAATAREIAALPQLPAAAGAAFTTIASRVEASRFALRALAAPDWQAARGAYAEFALQRLTG